MRALVMLLIGLFTGILTTATALNLMALGEAGPRPHVAMMGMLQYHLGEARGLIEPGCEAGRGERHFLLMRGLSDHLEQVYVERGYDETLFGRHARQFRGRLDDALALPEDASCRARADALSRVQDGCQSCHRDFGRG